VRPAAKPTRTFAASLIAVLAPVSAFSKGLTSDPSTENGKPKAKKAFGYILRGMLPAPP
jgi:hypothetical protein